MTNEQLTDLVEEWHLAEPWDAAASYTLEEWIRMHTHWNAVEYETWVRTGLYTGEGRLG